MAAFPVILNGFIVKMLYKMRAGLALALFLSPVASFAQLALGGAVAWNESIYKGYNKNNHVLPIAHYEGANFYFRQTSLGYILARNDQNEFSLTGTWFPWAFDPAGNDDAAMKRLDKRKDSVMAGGAWYHHARWGSVKLTAMADVLDNSSGWVGDISLFRILPLGRLQVTPTAGVSYYDSRFNRYYYGITGSESRRSGLATYTPGGGWTPWVGTSIKYSLTPRLAFNVSAIYTALPDEVKNSPMVDRRDSFATLTSVTWQF